MLISLSNKFASNESEKYSTAAVTIEITMTKTEWVIASFFVGQTTYTISDFTDFK